MTRPDFTGGAYLGEPRGSRRSVQATARDMLCQPRAALSVLTARLMGKRLRARQRLAALIGIDHRLALPATEMNRPCEEASARGSFIILGSGTLLQGASERIERAFADDPHLQALYGDGLVQREAGGPVFPILPPAFDPDLLMSVDYLGPLAVRRDALSSPSDPLAAAFAIAERYGPNAVGHLPGLLFLHRPGDEPSRDRLTPVRAHLDRTGREAVMLMMETGGIVRVTHPLPETPLVSVIVPTRDRLDLLRPCLEALRTRTAWPRLEILVCDNESREPETLAYLRALAGEGRGASCPVRDPLTSRR
ncbi:glycosyltransferase [Methylobacterium komagatae]|uniref:Glycosyltransferase n=1 Tax=Methylobacterium komagatae TaxID=374425 RepID=A0ABW2BIS0_9HYPH